MNNRVLSIEIGNSFTKICEMDYKVKKPKVYKVLTVETPEGIVVDGMLQPTQEYADHLVNALGTNGIRTKKVLFTISSTRVASREVQIPNVKANKIEALVKTNASDYFPVDLTQYEIGHYLAGGLAENGKLRVMALAVPKALLNSYYQLAQMCGWEIECFDYSSNSLYQILRDEKSEKVTMVIKIDENSTIVTVLSAGKVLLQRTVAYGVQDAIDTMIASGAYAVNDPMSAVERFQKKTCLNRVLHPGDKVWEENAGRWEDEDAGNVEVTAARQKITASLEPLIVGVSRVIDFYDSRNSENPIEKSYVTGLGGSFSGMSKLFTNCLERKVHTLSEMDDKIGMSKAIRSTRPAAYISCLGAVLAPVGLIDKSTQKSKGLTVVSGTNYTFVSVAVLVLGVILSIAMAATSVTRYLGNVAQNVYLQNRVQELQPAQAVYNDYLAAEAQYDKYTYLYAYTQTPNENLVEFINELEQILPDSFYTNSFSSDQTGISMSVTVEGKAAAARTILNIRNMQSIDDVEISNITDSKDETGTSIVTFSITGSYKELTDETEERHRPTPRQHSRRQRKMKVKKSEIQLLIAVIGVLIAVCTYFLVYSKFNEKSDALEAENATLSSQVATLEILDQRKADYIEATGKMQSYITNFENRFPADILPEDSIMMVKTLEDYTRTEVANIAFGSEAEVVYTPAADAATTTADATAATDTTATDAAADTTAAAETTVASPVSTDGTAYADTHMYEVPLSISISCTYDDFKGLVRYIYNQQERESIQGVSISYNETDGMLTGNMTMNTYYLLGTDKVYSSPYIPDMQMGVDTIFGNVE